MKLGEAMYQAQQAEGGDEAAGGGGAEGGTSSSDDESVVDADFEEVDPDKGDDQQKSG